MAALILCLLAVGAYAVRYQTVSTAGMAFYRINRWTGEIALVLPYGVSIVGGPSEKATQRPAPSPPAPEKMMRNGRDIFDKVAPDSVAKMTDDELRAVAGLR